MTAKHLRFQVVWPYPHPLQAPESQAFLEERGFTSSNAPETLFGMQCGRRDVLPGAPLADGSLMFETEVAPYVDKAGRQRFKGDCVQGPPDQPFLYLSWRLSDEQPWIARGKVLLTTVTRDVLDGLPEEATLKTVSLGLGHRPAAGHVQVWEQV